VAVPWAVVTTWAVAEPDALAVTAVRRAAKMAAARQHAVVPHVAMALPGAARRPAEPDAAAQDAVAQRVAAGSAVRQHLA